MAVVNWMLAPRTHTDKSHAPPQKKKKKKEQQNSKRTREDTLEPFLSLRSNFARFLLFLSSTHILSCLVSFTYGTS